jgi:hypothetical protein
MPASREEQLCTKRHYSKFKKQALSIPILGKIQNLVADCRFYFNYATLVNSRSDRIDVRSPWYVSI